MIPTTKESTAVDEHQKQISIPSISMSIPLLTSPGRSGFGPSLPLSYGSGVGNAPFGCSLALPAINRKTDKGFPRYQDDKKYDFFLPSDAKDLSPVFRRDSDGSRVRDRKARLFIHENEINSYRIRRYKPRPYLKPADLRDMR